MLNLIKNNPFRILGVYANATLKEVTANQTKMRAYLKVGRAVEFPTDLQPQLGTVERTSEIIEKTITQINLPQDKLLYALFWFANTTPIDKVAFSNLQAGNVDKAIECWDKKECFSSLLNKCTLFLLLGNYAAAIPAMQTLMHTSAYRMDLLQSVCGDTFSIDETELLELFITNLLKEIKVTDILGCFSDNYPNDKTYIKEQAAQVYINEINAEIAKAKSTDSGDARANYLVGYSLMNNTKTPLTKLKAILPSTDMLFQQTVDKLANQILQSGINYFNNTDDDDNIEKSLTLQNYALSIAVGKLAKDRCQKNVDILEKKKKEAPPTEVKNEAKAVIEELVRFCELPDKISHAVTLLKNTRNNLLAIKNKLGVTNAYYLKLSTQVVGNALHNIIEEVNESQKPLSGYNAYLLSDIEKNSVISNIRTTLRKAWEATLLMDEFDLESDFKRDRYNPNRQSLKELCNSAGVSTYSGSSSTSSSRSRGTTTTTTPSGSTFWDDYGGCLVQIIIYGFIAFCIAMCAN